METARRCLQSLKRNWSWLRWPVALGLLGYLFLQNRTELGQLAERQIDWFCFLVAFALCGGSIILTFVRWYLLVWALEFRFRLRDALRLGFIGYLFNYVGPGSAGGDIVKAVMIAGQQESRRTVAAATVLLDRILGLLALFMVGSMAALFHPSFVQHGTLRAVVVALWGGSLAGLIGLGMMLHPAVPRSRWLNRLVHLRYVGRAIGDLINGVLLYQTKRRVLLVAVGISVVGHFGMLSCFYFCAQALQWGDAAPGYWAHLLLIPIAELAGVVVPLPGGVGALEGAVGFCYQQFNEAVGGAVSGETAWAAGLSAAVVYRCISIIVATIGIGYYLTSRREIDEVLEESSDAASNQAGDEDGETSDVAVCVGNRIAPA